MLSSGDVAQMFAAQNQMFMGQNQFASQIGVANPGMSLASWGTDPRQKAFGASGTFGGHSPVSYAPTGMTGPGYGGGTKMAGGAMSLMGGAASAAAGMMFDPFSAAMAGSGIAPSLFGRSAIGMMAGGGLAGGAAAAGAAFLPMYAAQKGIQAFVGGGQQQQAIGSALGSFGFQNTSSRTGQGFSRDDAQQIGNQVRAIAHIPEMMTSVEELTKLIPKLKSSGVMSGVRDASEFNSRFKEAVKTLRDVSRVIGTTMEEASQFFEHSRSVGFLGRTDQIKNAMNVKFTAAQTGMSDQQVMQLQQSGAQMAVGRGIRRQVGAASVTNMSQQFARGMQSGNISQSDLEDMTGVSGEAAVGAAAQQMTEKLARFAESTAAGRASMMGLAEFDDKGRYKGINKELAQKYATGEVSKEDLMRRIAGFSSQQKISASRKVGSMAIEFAGATGPGGAMSFMKNVLAEGGHTGEAGKFMMQKYGFSEVEVDVMSQMEGMGMSGSGEDRQKKAFERKQQMKADIADRTDPSKIMSRIGTKMKGMGGPLSVANIEAQGAKMFSFIGKAYDEFIDDVVGNYSMELSEKGAQRLLQSFQSQKGKEDMKALFAMKMPQYSPEASSTKLGKMFAGAQGVATLGGSLLAQGGLNAAGKNFDKGVGGIASLFSGGGMSGAGDVTQQRDTMQKYFGMSGAEDSDVNARFKELKSMAGGTEDDKARQQVQDAIDHLNATGGFRDASTPADKMKMLTEELESRSSTLGIGGGRVSAVEDFIKRKGLGKGGANKMAESAMALTKTGTFSKEGFASGEAQIRDLAKKTALSIRAADDHLLKVFGDDAGKEISSAISSDSQIGTNLRNALENPAVAAALNERDDSDGARKLETALGKPKGSISEAEYRKTKEGHDRIKDALEGLSEDDKKKKKEEMGTAIGFRELMEDTKGTGVMQIAARDLADSMGSGDLKSALRKFAGAEGLDAEQGKSEVQEVITKSVGRFMDARKELQAATNSKDKGRIDAAQKKFKALTDELGTEVSGRIAQESGRFDSKAREISEGSVLSKADVSEKLGISEESLSKLGLGSSIKLDKATLAKIKQSKVGTNVAGESLVGTEAQAAKNKEEQMTKTLTSIDETNKNILSVNKLLTTTIAIAHGVTKEKIADYDKTAESQKADADSKKGMGKHG